MQSINDSKQSEQREYCKLKKKKRGGGEFLHSLGLFSINIDLFFLSLVPSRAKNVYFKIKSSM